jgi:hypothetical protein
MKSSVPSVVYFYEKRKCKKMNENELIDWLLEGDVSIQYQAYRDLLAEERSDLRDRIATEGWGARFLSKQNDKGHWGRKFYQPKWISTHYTLLDLRNLCISPQIPVIKKTIDMLLDEEKGVDGGVNPAVTIPDSDVCVNGMFLSYACYFKADENKLHSLIDFILTQRMEDGGFNCLYNQSGAKHSSLHSTLSLLEGLTEYTANGYRYRFAEIEEAIHIAQDFILKHRLYLSDQTGKIINNKFLRMPYPSRWFYDTLRALDYFRFSGRPFNEKMLPAIDELLKRRKEDNTWLLQAPYPGQRHFDMEEAGKPSRWNTLRAMRVLKHFSIEH